MTTHKIDHYIAGLAEAKAAPFLDRAALASAAPAPLPIRPDVAAHIRNRVEREAAKQALAEFDEWPAANRASIAGDKYLKDHALEISKTLYKDLDQRTAKLPSVLNGYAKRISTLAIEAFASEQTRESNRIQRDEIEAEAAELEHQVSRARSSVRSFEISPSPEGFSEACARVAELNFSATA